MNNNEQTTEKLIQYLDGELHGEELDGFEQMLAENTGMQRELETLILAREAIKNYGLKAQVASVHQEMMHELRREIMTIPKKNKIRFLHSMPLNIAASLLIILFSAGLYQYITISGTKIFNENYHTYELSVSRGEDNGVSEIDKAYAKNQPDLVIAEFKKLIRPDVKDYFLAGQIYLSKNQINQATQCFLRVLENGATDNTFKDDAEYYLALSYLKNNEPLKARPIFQKINKDKDHLYHDQVSNWTMLKLEALTLKSSVKK